MVCPTVAIGLSTVKSDVTVALTRPLGGPSDTWPAENDPTVDTMQYYPSEAGSSLACHKVALSLHNPKG